MNDQSLQDDAHNVDDASRDQASVEQYRSVVRLNTRAIKDTKYTQHVDSQRTDIVKQGDNSNRKTQEKGGRTWRAIKHIGGGQEGATAKH